MHSVCHLPTPSAVFQAVSHPKFYAARSNNYPSLTQPAAGPPPHSRQHPHNLATPNITKMVAVQILTCLMFMQQNGGCTMAQAHQILENWQQGF